MASRKLEVVHLNFDFLYGTLIDDENATAVDAWEVLRFRKDTLREVKLAVMGRRVETGELSWWCLAVWKESTVLKVGDKPLKALKAAWDGASQDNIVAEDGFLRNLFPRGMREVIFCHPRDEFIPELRQLSETRKAGRYPLMKLVCVVPSSDRLWTPE